MARRPMNTIIQRHHIYYDPPKTVLLRATEHYICTMLQRMKTPTKGFLVALKYYIRDNKKIALSGKYLKEQFESLRKLKALTKRKR